MKNWYIIINWSLYILQSIEKKGKLKTDFLYSIPEAEAQEVTFNLVFWSRAFLGYDSLSYFPCFYDPGSLRALSRDIIVWSSIGICLMLFLSGNWADVFWRNAHTVQHHFHCVIPRLDTVKIIQDCVLILTLTT